jgi:hypothetical protein
MLGLIVNSAFRRMWDAAVTGKFDVICGICLGTFRYRLSQQEYGRQQSSQILGTLRALLGHHPLPLEPSY